MSAHYKLVYVDLWLETGLLMKTKYLKLVHLYNVFAAGAKWIRQSLFLCS